MADDEREFDYIRGSERGPEHWGELNPEWATCSTGKLQSPIDLLHKRVQVIPKFAEITRFYQPTRAILRNRGHDIEVISSTFLALFVFKFDFELASFDFLN